MGVWADVLSLIVHSSNEFVDDCAQILPGMPKAKVCSKGILNPLNVKRLCEAVEPCADGFLRALID